MRFFPNLQTFRRMSLSIRQNFSPQCEKAINEQINTELNACYEYMAMAWHFNRTDVALPGVCKWLKKCSNEEKEHAEKFMTYLNKRGGTILLQDIEKPKFEFVSLMKTMTYALELEKLVNKKLLDLHAIATQMNDPHLCDFIETEYLTEQVDAIKEISDYIRQIERCENELGIHIFDIKFNKNDE